MICQIVLLYLVVAELDFLIWPEAQINLTSVKKVYTVNTELIDFFKQNVCA